MIVLKVIFILFCGVVAYMGIVCGPIYWFVNRGN